MVGEFKIKVETESSGIFVHAEDLENDQRYFSGRGFKTEDEAFEWAVRQIKECWK